MSAQLTVAGARELSAAMIATLPVSFRPSSAATADVIAVSGAPGWPDAVAEAVRGGARGVIVLEPAAASAEELSALGAGRPPVILSEGFAGNPAVRVAADRWAPTLRSAFAVTSIATDAADRPLGELVLRQLRLLRRLGIDGARPAVGVAGPSSYAHGGTILDAQLSLFGATSDAEPAELRVTATSADGVVEIVLFSPGSARPADARHVTERHATTLPTIYETAHRAAFRRLHEAVETGGAGDDLAAFAADSAAAEMLATHR